MPQQNISDSTKEIDRRLTNGSLKEEVGVVSRRSSRSMVAPLPKHVRSHIETVPSSSWTHNLSTITCRLTSSTTFGADSAESLNLFESSERLKIIIVSNIPSFWTINDCIKVLERFGPLVRYDEVQENRKRTLIIKFETSKAAFHAYISLSTRNVGFGSKRLNIRYSRGEFFDHPILLETETEETEKMRREIADLLEPMFSTYMMLGVPNRFILHSGAGKSRVCGFIFGIIYPLLVSAILLYSGCFLFFFQGYRAFESGHPDYIVLATSCGSFICINFVIHIFHCREMAQPISSIGLVPFIKCTVQSIDSLKFISATVENESRWLIPKILVATLLLSTIFFFSISEADLGSLNNVIVGFGGFYAIAVAFIASMQIKLYSRIVENGFRSKMRDLLVGELEVSQIKKHYILISLLTQEAFERQKVVTFCITSIFMFSTIFIAANIFIVSGLLKHSSHIAEMLSGFAFNISNQVWWFSTMYEAARATGAFKDLLDNLRGPLYVPAKSEDQAQVLHLSHVDLDAFIPGITLFGRVLNTNSLALAARLNASIVGVIAFRVLLVKFTGLD